MSITVCMFTNLYPPVMSGSSTQSAKLSRELVRRGLKVIVITAQTNSNQCEYEIVDGVSIYRLPSMRLPKMRISFNFPWLSLTFTPGNIRRIARILRTEAPDVLHLHNHMFDLALSAALMQHQLHKPLVVTIHTIVKHSIAFYNLLLYPFDRIFLNFLSIRSAREVISPDVNIQQYVAEAFGRRNSVIVPYGISLPPISGTDVVEALREKYGLTNKKVILSLGHVNENRNREDVIDAMPYIIEKIPNAVLLIVGGIASAAPLQQTMTLGLEKNVIFTDHVDHGLIPVFLQLADLEAHWINQDIPEHTSLGIASLEAMYAGKVVIAAANPDTHGQGILKDGKNIIIVKPGQPIQLAQTIIDLLADDKRRVRIGACAHQTIREHFSWDSVCEKTIMIYQAAIQAEAKKALIQIL